MPLDSQQIELIGRNVLIAQLLADGLEVAVPQRDRGIDLIVYADLDEGGRFIALPIQMKAAKVRSFGVDRKYDKFPQLLLAHVWNVTEPAHATTICVTQAEATAVADSMGWTATKSWTEGNAYSTTQPSARLLALLQPFVVTPGGWRSRLGIASAQP